MSLEQAAKHLAAHGRGTDTELVHMTKGEVNSLRQLAKHHGGTLTVNPHTGLQEAGFLKSLMPALIGAAIVGTGGAAALGLAPWMVGAGIGGVQAARTGSLKEGLMAGLGAYGGAGLASGLATAGAGAAQTTANQAVAASPQYAGLQATPSLPGAFGEAAGSATPTFASEGARQAALTNAQNTLASPGASMLSGAQGLGSEAGRTAFGKAVTGSGSTVSKLGLAAAAPVIGQMLSPQNTQPTVKSDSVMPQRLQYNVGRATDPNTGQAYTPAADVPGYGDLGRDFGRERDYFPTAGYQNITPEQAKSLRGYADGGDVESNPNRQEVPTFDPVVRMADGGIPDINSMTGEQNEFARGGLNAAASHLGDYSDGGRLLKGPGDGVSDSIPATIGNKRPARLADGEFVVPARIVSELGNGSTEAGARKLYAMLDRVQKARGKTVGKGKVAKNSRADKFLPA
jgi:hypothetical protein